MEDWIKQMRLKFPSLGDEIQDEQSSTREGRIPPQKTVSFKGERKKTRSWSPRLLSGQMSDSDHINDGDYETAIAAAAYAITNMEEEQDSLKQSNPKEGLGRSPTKIKSKGEDSMNKQTETSKISRWLSSKEAKEDGKTTGGRSTRKFTTFDESLLKNYNSTDKETPKRETGEKTTRKSKTLDQRMLEELTIDQEFLPKKKTIDHEIREKAKGTTPTMKKMPTFSDAYLNDTGNNKADGRQPEAFRYPRTMKSRKEETKAEIWERKRMEKIRKWYEKKNTTILEWENKNKLKAKRRFEKQESELTRRRAMYLQEYRNEISKIDKMAGGARTISVERKRNKELTAKEKANRIRSTGKVPRRCFCF